MANYMADVAKLLGVELGEVFKCDNGHEYMFTNIGIRCPYNETHIFSTNELDYVCVLWCLLNGDLTIIPTPYKPKKHGELYLYVDKKGDTWTAPWYDYELDILRYKLGNCYRTRKEAEADKDKWIAFYASDELIEV